MKLLNLCLLLCLILLFGCKKEIEGDPLLVPILSPGFEFVPKPPDSAWIHRVVGSRHRLLFSGPCNDVTTSILPPTPSYRWYESVDNDSFYVAGITKDKIFALDRYYYGAVLCGPDTMVTDTVGPCWNLTAYFDYIPDPDCTFPFNNILRPRVALMNNCTVTEVEWFKGKVPLSLGITDQVILKNKDVYSIIFHCTAYGCSDTTTFTYLESPAFRLQKKSGYVELRAPSSLKRDDVRWFARHPSIGGWAEAQGGSYSTFRAYNTPGYKYYARVRYLNKIYFTNQICL